MNKYSDVIIPGIFKSKLKSSIIKDLLFFIAVFAIPTSFFAFLPLRLFYDVSLLYWLIGMLYCIFYFKYIKKIGRLPGGKWLILVVLFIIFRFGYSIFIDNIPFSEVVTIFRTNFHYPITALGFLLYASNMDNKRINRLLHWTYHTTLILGFVYMFSNLTNIEFYSVVAKEDSEAFETLGQNLSALPRYLNILFIVGLLTAFTLKAAKYHLFWAVPLILTVLSIVRNQIIVYILTLLLFILFGYFYFKEIRLGRIVQIGLLLLVSLLIISFVFSHHIAEVIDKFGFSKNEQVKVSNYTKEGTYYFRLKLIEDAYIRTKANGNLLLGNGYQRESIKGQYDFVIGRDTFIAPVLFTEGLLGLFIRLLPVFFFLRFGMKYLKRHSSPYQYVSLVMVILIIPSIINGVQTRIFVIYTETLFIIYLFMLFYYNLQKQQIISDEKTWWKN